MWKLTYFEQLHPQLIQSCQYDEATPGYIKRTGLLLRDAYEIQREVVTI